MWIRTLYRCGVPDLALLFDSVTACLRSHNRFGLTVTVCNAVVKKTSIEG